MAFGLGMTSGIGALGTMGALGAGLAAGVDPRDIGVVSAIDSLHAEPQPDIAEPAPEPEPAAPAPGAPAAGAGGGRGGGPDLSVGGRGGYGGRGFADTPAAMDDPGVQSGPDMVEGRGAGNPGGFGGGAAAGAGGIGGLGSSGRGASDPGVAGVPGGLSGRGAGGGRGFGRRGGSSRGSQFGGGRGGTGVGGGGHGEAAGEGSCYISTATCGAHGWGDFCRPLEILRDWRDNVLRPVRGGQQAVEFYYRSAPQIVAAIDARPNRDAVYEMIWRRFLRPFIAAVAAGKNRRAFVVYMTMVLALRRAFR